MRQQARARLHHDLGAGREAGEGFVVGDLPRIGRRARQEADQHRDRAGRRAGSQSMRSPPRAALAPTISRAIAAIGAMRLHRRAAPPLPAGGFERQELLEAAPGRPTIRSSTLPSSARRRICRRIFARAAATERAARQSARAVAAASSIARLFSPTTISGRPLCGSEVHGPPRRPSPSSQISGRIRLPLPASPPRSPRTAGRTCCRSTSGTASGP